MKIALIGSAPSSVGLAPYGDPSWEIWACSPSSMGLPRIDVFFEIHSMAILGSKQDETLFLTWMKGLKKVYLQKEDPRFKSERYPIEEMISKYGRWFFSSTLAYMFALAISKKPEKIGVWGVDMQAASEYEHQRTGCQFFIHEAGKQGIDVVIPAESDLQYPLPLYGYCELDPVWVKLQTKKKEYSQRLEAEETKRIEAALAISRLQGGMEQLNYQMRTFVQGAVDDPDEQEGAGGTVTSLRRRETS